MKTPVALLFLVIAGCGSRAPDMIHPDTSLFPLAIGHRWEYRVTDSGAVTTKVQTITGTIAVAARRGYLFTTENGPSRTDSVQILDGTLLARVSEQEWEDGIPKPRVVFGPPSLRVDIVAAGTGVTYEERHTEIHLSADASVLNWVTKDQTFVIEAVDEQVSVPAGSYRAVRIRRDTEGGPSKTFWYARGVGKIKEVGGQTEELSAVELAD